MAFNVTPGSGASMKTTLDGSDHVVHHRVDVSALPAGASTSAEQTAQTALLTAIDAWAFAIRTASGNVTDAAAADASASASQIAVNKALLREMMSTDPAVAVGFTAVVPGNATLTRPADTSAYASGDLVANSVTAGSVVPLNFSAARVNGETGVIVGARLQKSGTGVTNAAFRLHLFTIIPTWTASGDNSAMSANTQALAKGYLGFIDIPAMIGFQDCAWGTGVPDNFRSSLPFAAAAESQLVYGVLEARGAYTPVSAEVFTAALMVLQD